MLTLIPLQATLACAVGEVVSLPSLLQQYMKCIFLIKDSWEIGDQTNDSEKLKRESLVSPDVRNVHVFANINTTMST